jgi:uncharacterized protein YdeI (YjbR/CyaY-like superfamily)
LNSIRGEKPTADACSTITRFGIIRTWEKTEIDAMSSRHPHVDAYIERSADFAHPILEHLRTLVHAACPDVEENIKWGCPHFGYKGGMMCSMAAFKHYCSFGFWNYKDIVGKEPEEGAGSFGKITSVKDLPGKKELTGYIRKAMALKDAGVKKERPKTAPKPAPKLPADLAAELKKNVSARKHYEAFSPSAQREYVDWINEAKTDATRQKRVATTLE